MSVIIKENIEISDEAVEFILKKLTNQIYKLLPTREEGNDWEKPLETVIEELSGMNLLLIDQHKILFPLICKLEGLLTLTEKEDFSLFRRTIFECLGLINSLKNNVFSNVE